MSSVGKFSRMLNLNDDNEKDDKNIQESQSNTPSTSPASSELHISLDNATNTASSHHLFLTEIASNSPNVTVKTNNNQPPSAKTDNLRQNYVLRKGNKIIYTAGRPPWYDYTTNNGSSHNQPYQAFVIGLGGGSASGKTTVANNIIKALDVPWVALVTMDSFYREYNEAEKELIRAGEFDFDRPTAMDFDLMVTTLTNLRAGKSVTVPVYNFSTHRRENSLARKMYGANVIIFEGIHAFYDKRITDLMDIKIFVDTDSDVRLARRLLRDIAHRGRDLTSVLMQYEKFVKPSFTHYIAPTMAIADIIIPRGGDNYIALDLITDHLKSQLAQRGFKQRTILLNNAFSGRITNGMMVNHSKHLTERNYMDNFNSENNNSKSNNNEHFIEAPGLKTLPSIFVKPDNVYLTPQVSQTIGLHTYIRNKDISPADFIFYTRRLSRIALEYASTFLPYKVTTIETPQNKIYTGMRKRSDIKICAVSIIRAGETSERSLFDIFPSSSISLAQILIQTNSQTGEPELFYYRLPSKVKDCHVIVMDPTAATGATATMAIRVLIDHEVPEQNIIFVALILSEIATQTIAYAFPKLRIVTTAIDPHVNSDFYILPGVGNFGDRYYGTESKAIQIST